jgi:hypothetical protein
MKKRTTYDHADVILYHVKHHPTVAMFETFTDVPAFKAAVKALPSGWKCAHYTLHSGKREAVIIGPKIKMTLTLDAANTIKRIMMNRCNMDPDAAAGFSFNCDAAAAGYIANVQQFGRWPDRRGIRDELNKLRKAVKIGTTAKDALMLAAMQRGTKHPDTMMFCEKGKAFAFPDFVLGEIEAYADQVLEWLNADEHSQGGRPKPIRARQLIREIARTFTEFTGKRCTATPRTPFYEIVRQVLMSLGLQGHEPRKMIMAALADPTGASEHWL